MKRFLNEYLLIYILKDGNIPLKGYLFINSFKNLFFIKCIILYYEGTNYHE